MAEARRLANSCFCRRRVRNGADASAAILGDVEVWRRQPIGTTNPSVREFPLLTKGAITIPDVMFTTQSRIQDLVLLTVFLIDLHPWSKEQQNVTAGNKKNKRHTLARLRGFIRRRDNEWVRVARLARGGMRRHASRHEDILAATNDSVGWHRPGFIFDGVMKGLQPGRRYFYKAGRHGFNGENFYQDGGPLGGMTWTQQQGH